MRVLRQLTLLASLVTSKISHLAAFSDPDGSRRICPPRLANDRQVRQPAAGIPLPARAPAGRELFALFLLRVIAPSALGYVNLPSVSAGVSTISVRTGDSCSSRPSLSPRQRRRDGLVTTTALGYLGGLFVCYFGYECGDCHHHLNVHISWEHCCTP